MGMNPCTGNRRLARIAARISLIAWIESNHYKSSCFAGNW